MTASDPACILAIVLVGVLAGNELCTLIIHASLETLPVSESMPVVKLVIRRMGTIMPIIMPATLVLVLVTAWITDGVASILLLAAGALMVAMIAVTFAVLMPLNANHLNATSLTPEPTWRAWRKRWLRFHGMRVVLDLGALALVATSAILS